MKFRITVIKKMENRDLAEQFCQTGTNACPCPAHKEGQEFFTEFEKPEGFCEWAWDDIYKYVAIFRSGGNMGDAFNWMKTNNNVVVCCTDGIRPVVFNLEKICE